MRVQDICSCLEAQMPLWLQESYDNCGLQVGDPNAEIHSALLCVDLTEAVVNEAIELGAGLIITHHPPLFKGIKSLQPSNYINRSILKAIEHKLAIYSAHTNADNAPSGLNYLLAEDFQLKNAQPLEKIKGQLMELVVYVPRSHRETLRTALFEAGAGKLGAYDSCSFSSSGEGTFRPLSGSKPFIGKQGELACETEDRLSLVLNVADSSAVVRSLHAHHPYEVPAYSLIPLANDYLGAGAGIIGDLEEPVDTQLFLRQVKDYFESEKISYSKTSKTKIRRVALCGGSGAFLWKKALSLGADIFITGEAKYNDYFDVEDRLILTTVGHYESEVVASKLFYSIISKKFPNFAIHRSKLNSNPILSI